MRTRASAVLLTILACIFMLELGLRAIGRSPTNMAEGIAEQYGDSFKLKKNMTKVIKFPAFTYTVHTNEFGFRDRATGPRGLEGKHFCVFLGASDVFGNGVDFEDSFVGVFSQESSKQGLEVLNLAVGGHYFIDQELLLKDFIRETGFKPASVFYCVNALHIPKFDRRNKNIIVKNGYVIDKDGWRFAFFRLMVGNTSSAFCFFRDAVRRIQEKYFRYERTEKSPEFLQIYEKSNAIRQPERIRQFNNHLELFESFCRENSIELIYLYLPLSDSFNIRAIAQQLGTDPDNYDPGFYEDVLRSHCEKVGVRLLNVRPILESHHMKGEVLRFKLDPHFNVTANRIIGEYLIEKPLVSVW